MSISQEQKNLSAIIIFTTNIEKFKIVEQKLDSNPINVDFKYSNDYNHFISLLKELIPVMVIVDLNTNEQIEHFKKKPYPWLKQIPYLYLCDQNLRLDKILRILDRVDDYIIEPVKESELERQIKIILQRVDKVITASPSIFQLNQEEKLFKEIYSQLFNIYNETRQSQYIELYLIQELSQKIINKTLQNDSFQLLAQTHRHNKSVILKTFRMAIFATLLGRELGYSINELHLLITTVLLYYIGIIERREKNFNNIDIQQTNIQEMSRRLILKSITHDDNFFKNVLKIIELTLVVAENEENRFNIEDEKLLECSKIILLIERFVSCIENQKPEKGPSTFTALQEIIKYDSEMYPVYLKRAMVKSISIYPLGTLVKLNTGETGRVVRTNPKNPTRPVVELLFDADGKPYIFPIKKNLVDHPFTFIMHILSGTNISMVDDVLTL